MTRLVQIIGLIAIAALFGCKPSGDIKLAMSGAENPDRNAPYSWAKAFKDALVAEGVEVVVYPSSSLGGELARTEQIRAGLLEVNMTGFQEVGVFAPLFEALFLPFMFDSQAHIDRALQETDLLDRINAQTLRKGVRVVDVAFFAGMSGLHNTKRPITKLEDLDGVRMRAQETNQLRLLSSWGVSATQVAWEEIAQALQTGIVDGYINPPLVSVTFGHASQLKYYTDLRTNPAARAIVFSEEWYKSLSPAMRAKVDAAVVKARATNRAWSEKLAVEGRLALENAGVKVTDIEDAERRRFAERSRTTYTDILPAPIIAEAEAVAAETRQ